MAYIKASDTHSETALLSLASLTAAMTPTTLMEDLTLCLNTDSSTEQPENLFQNIFCALLSKYPTFYMDAGDAVFIRSGGLQEPSARQFLVYIFPIIMAFGTIANIISIAVMRTKDMRYG